MEKILVLNEQLVDEVCKWLSNHVKQISNLLFEAFIFGSVARYKANPNDCDLMLVTINGISDKQWRNVQKEKFELQSKFYKEFRLKLSVLLATYDEFKECNGLMTRIRNGNRIFLSL